MKKIFFEPDGISLSAIKVDSTPIFTMRGGKISGMVVKEAAGWITRIGGSFGVNGHHPNIIDCIQSGVRLGYTYHVEE